MTDTKFLTRADHVGSLLRPGMVKKARQKFFDEKTITQEELKKIEDRAIHDLIEMQEEIGLDIVTDGEARRSFWHYDFMEGINGLDLVERNEGVQFSGIKLRPIFPVINDRLTFPKSHPMISHFNYVANKTFKIPKISIPGPSCCHFRTALQDIRYEPYRDTNVLFQDLIKTYSSAVNAFYDAGCRYLQLDDIFFAYLCDPKHREAKKDIGQDPDWLIEMYANVIRESIKNRPSDMTIGMHMCRGNFRSSHAAEGSYDAVADQIFNNTDVDVFYLEYDTERAGDLSPLNFLSSGQQRVMLGFITTKSGKLETIEEVKSKFKQAERFADISQLGIAPQCGFASTEEGNTINFDEQKRKLELVLECAENIW